MTGFNKKKQAISRHVVTGGDAVQLPGGLDREAQIRNTLERLKQEKTQQAQRESQTIIEQSYQQADGIIARAQQQAAQIIAEAEATKAEIHQQGYAQGKEEGYQDGYRDGRENAEQDAQLLMLSANTLLVRAYEAQVEVLQGFNTHAITIMKAILKRVLDEVMVDFTDEQWVTWLSNTIKQLNIHGKYRLVISDASYQQFRQFSPLLAKSLDELDRFHVVVDPNLAVTEMYILGDDSNVDISPIAQVEQFLETLVEHMNLHEAITPEALNPPEELDEFSEILNPYFQTTDENNDQAPEQSTATEGAQAQASPNADHLEASSTVVPQPPHSPSVAMPSEAPVPIASPPQQPEGPAPFNALPDLSELPDGAVLSPEELDALSSPPTNDNPFPQAGEQPAVRPLDTQDRLPNVSDGDAALDDLMNLDGDLS